MGGDPCDIFIRQPNKSGPTATICAALADVSDLFDRNDGDATVICHLQFVIRRRAEGAPGRL
jgi:hypothetical protein